MTKSAPEILRDCAALYEERNKVYGDNFLRVGNMMHSMFPQGLTIASPEDWNRVHMILLSVVKTSRYATNFAKGGHKDSVLDAVVYTAMLAYIDELQTPQRCPGCNQPVAPSGPDGTVRHDERMWHMECWRLQSAPTVKVSPDVETHE